MTFQLASHDSPSRMGPDGEGNNRAFENMVGRSPVFTEAITLAEKVAARRRTTVLLMGETGTGKELFARGVHYASRASGEPFVAVNCAAIPGALLESELFGHERGAFTDARSKKRGLMELAGEGTLFLDEVRELPPQLQPKLLRALEERKVRRLGGLEEIDVGCRIIAASNRALEEDVTEGRFREDLFYRLNVFRIRVPSLRERENDVILLARFFLRVLAKEQGLEPNTLMPSAMTALQEHSWPGNVRQLKNTIERAAILAGGDPINEDHLRIPSQADRRKGRESLPFGGGILIPPEGKSMEEIEGEAIRLTLRLTGGNQTAAARILGLSRQTVIRKMKVYGLSSGPKELAG